MFVATNCLLEHCMLGAQGTTLAPNSPLVSSLLGLQLPWQPLISANVSETNVIIKEVREQLNNKTLNKL